FCRVKGEVRKPGRSATTKFRISPQSCTGMPWHINLRDYLDEPLGSIGYDFPDVLLCIKFGCLIRFQVTPDTSDKRQLRILLNLDPPCRLVSQMPVKTIKLI